MSVYLVPTKHSGVTNSNFNNNNFNPTQTTINSAKYVQLTSALKTGVLSSVCLTSTNGFTTTGTKTFIIFNQIRLYQQQRNLEVLLMLRSLQRLVFQVVLQAYVI